MLYIAILPAWMLLIAVAFAAAKLIFSRQKAVSSKNIWVINFVFFITIIQLAASVLALYFTDTSSISWEACRIGMYGRYASPAMLVFEALLLVFMAFRLRIHPVSIFLLYKPFIITVLSSHLIVFIIVLRSALRCTV